MCLFLSPSLLNDLLHSRHMTGVDVEDDAPRCCVVALDSSSAPRQVVRHPRLDLIASLYQSSSGTLISCKSALITSRHLLLGPPLGQGCGSHPNRHLFGVRLSGIRARWPSHSRRHAVTFSETVAGSPQRRLTSCDVMRCAHCCLLEMPKMVLKHLWWNESSFLLCFLRGSSILTHTEVQTKRKPGRCSFSSAAAGLHPGIRVCVRHQRL